MNEKLKNAISKAKTHIAEHSEELIITGVTLAAGTILVVTVGTLAHEIVKAAAAEQLYSMTFTNKMTGDKIQVLLTKENLELYKKTEEKVRLLMQAAKSA